MRESSTELMVDLPADSNVTDLLLAQHKRAPKAALYAVKTDGVWKDVSADSFLGQVRTLAKGLIARGVQPGDSVAVMSKTRYEWTLADLAIWFAGAVTVPVYETSSAHQVEFILKDSAAVVVLVENGEKAEVVRQAAPEAQIVLMNYDDGAASFASLASYGETVSDEVLESARSSRVLEDVASIVYTSGTTGRPKGCGITHANFALFAVNTIEFLPELLKEENTRTLMFLPLAHVLARAVQLVCLTGGVKLGHTSNATELLDDLAAYKPTFLLVVPRIFEKIYSTASQKAAAAGKGKLFRAADATAVAYSKALDAAARGGSRPSLLLRARHALFDRVLYPKLRAVFGGEVVHTVSGASPLSEHLAHFFRGAGINVLEGYGLTESTAPCTANTVSLTRVGSVGIPMPGTTIRVDDEGEVQVNGVGVFKGYHNSDEANAEAFTEDGFFRTGDLGSLDEDGFLWITGRKKDLLVTAGGKNVAPAPLEEKLREHPLVAHALVVGDNRPFVAALVTLDPEAVRSWIKTSGHSTRVASGALSSQVLSSEVLRAEVLSSEVLRAQLRAELQSAVDVANELVSRAEQIRKFDILDADFTVGSGYLTPTLKLKKAAVLADFGTAVEKLYA